MPGVSASSVDDRLASLLDTHGYDQHVFVPTRRSNRSDNLLDLLISSSSTSPQQMISNVDVRSSHHLSDHDLVLCDISVRRHKPSAVRYAYRNIKSIDLVDFEACLRSSQLFTDPAITPDEYLDQFEATATDLLDRVAPLRYGTRPGGRKAAKWLEPDAVAAKQLRRRLERRWKKSGNDDVRVAYRTACRRGNTLINASRNKFQCQRVVDVSGNPRRMWSAVKDLLHTDHSRGDGG